MHLTVRDRCKEIKRDFGVDISYNDLRKIYHANNVQSSYKFGKWLWYKKKPEKKQKLIINQQENTTQPERSREATLFQEIGIVAKSIIARRSVDNNRPLSETNG